MFSENKVKFMSSAVNDKTKEIKLTTYISLSVLRLIRVHKHRSPRFNWNELQKMHRRSDFAPLTTLSRQFIQWWSLRSSSRTTTNSIHRHRHSTVGRHNSWLYAARSHLKYPLMKATVKEWSSMLTKGKIDGERKKNSEGSRLEQSDIQLFHMTLSRAWKWMSFSCKRGKSHHALQPNEAPLTWSRAEKVMEKFPHFSARSCSNVKGFLKKVNVEISMYSLILRG